MQEPDVSVIIPVYNAAPWLHECLNSVLRQTGVTMQIICVNDGATDRSGEILAEYQLLYENVEVITQQNAGLSAARNAGLGAIRGRYSMFLDSDDYWRTDSLRELVANADHKGLDLELFDVLPFPALGVNRETWQRYRTYYRQRQQYLEPRVGLRLAADMQKNSDYRPAAWKYLFASSLITKNQLRFLPGVIHEDNAFTFHVFLSAQRAAQVSAQMYARRVRPESIMTTIAVERSVSSLEQVCSEMDRQLAKVARDISATDLHQLERIVQKVRDYSAKITMQSAAPVP